ncbi:hypothetical protein ACI2IX_02600 [Leifsonia aquatica]|uniref:hypothetical protein n=1 Tax=Leifsonia aquatica TaxID=144185 RepID=UPI00384F0F52
MTPGYSDEAIRALLSPQRLAPYIDRSQGDAVRALTLYQWSARMSGAAFETVAHLEVILRNSIDNALREFTAEDECGIPWFLRRPPMNDETESSISAVRDRLVPLARDTRHQIVAGLSFGFWSGMLGRRYEDLWRSAIRHAFPGSTGSRKQVATAVEAIRKFRNRLAHHDSMLNVDIPFEMRRIHQVADYISPDAGLWLRAMDRSGEVYRSRPASPIDTVVVPSREAWPFYEEHFAYVCQAGRWFQPVDRIAFYADREIKPEIPRIIDRRDNVTWTEHEAGRLATSTDRNDRKLSTVIRASRDAGWTDGTYQVFLLTRAGDPQHRSLSGSVPHTTLGRGSAFVQRQRYVSLHGLETAQTTADLV